MGNAKRVFLWTLVGTLTLAAGLGIWTVLFGSFLGLDEEVFGTLGTLFLFSLPALLAASMLERKRFVVANRLAIIVGLAGTAVYLAVIWSGGWYWGDEWLWKVMLLSAVWAWALPWAAALGLTRFDNALAAVRLASMTLVILLAGTISVLVFAEGDGDIAWRLLAVMGILAALGTLATPILHVIAGAAADTVIESTPLEMGIRCPRCLTEQTVAAGESRCRACRLRFTIEIEEPRCPRCRYLLHGLTEARCPECGEALAGEEVAGDIPVTGGRAATARERNPGTGSEGPGEPAP